MSNEFLYVEKYQPKTIADCILPQDLKDVFQQHADSGHIPNFLLTGPPGLGKTTIAKALCHEIDAEYLFINGSEENGIDVLRSKIKSFASTVSLMDQHKVIIIDEADYMNANSLQPALRSFIQEFSNNCRFIFTCNYVDRIIEPLHSRFAIVDFKINNKDVPKLQAQFFKRTLEILDAEDVKYDKAVIAEVIKKHFPDFRRVLNELQRYAPAGIIDSEILVDYNKNNYHELVKMMADKKFNDVRKWVGLNSDIDQSRLFKDLYTNSADFLVPETIPQLILILADYQYKAAFVADKEINLMACLTEIMSSCSFK